MRDIPGYSGLYAATEDGAIWSYRTNIYLSPTLTSHGYLRIALTIKQVQVKRHVHQWVMLAYYGESLGRDVNHKNSIKTDNRLDNLEYVTRKQNIHHAIAAGTNKIRGVGAAKAKLTEEQAKSIKYNESHLRNFQLAKKYNITPTAVSLIRRGINWKHV